MLTLKKRIDVMIYIFIVAVFVILCGAKFSKNDEFHRDYMSRETTGSVNGIFVLLVFMCHISTYMSLGTADKVWIDFKGYLGQLVVVTFLFYSGYGMMCSVSKKGIPYVKGLFKNRVLSLLLHFDIAVVLFAITNLLIKRSFSLTDFLVALTTWESIGNSNWYITAVLCLYIVMIISFLIFRRNNVLALVSTTGLTIVLAFVLFAVGRPAYYYYTLILFPLGMWYAQIKDAIDKFVLKNNWTYIIAVCLVMCVFMVSHKNRTIGLPVYWACACAFMVLIVFVSMKLKIGNPILEMLGRHVFSIYILQRIPMSVFKYLGFTNNNLNYFCMCFATTILMALVFDKAMAKLDAVLFKPKKVKA